MIRLRYVHLEARIELTYVVRLSRLVLEYGRAREALTVSLSRESTASVHLVQVKINVVAGCRIQVVQVNHLLLLHFRAVELWRLVRLLIKLWNLTVHARNTIGRVEQPRRILIRYLIQGKRVRAHMLR